PAPAGSCRYVAHPFPRRRGILLPRRPYHCKAHIHNRISKGIVMARWWFYLLAIGSMAFAACDSSGIDAPPIDEDIPAGGATTLFAVTSKAFSSPAPNLSADGLELHLQGDATFEATFVTAPATINAGL